jgi:hypothetical protein
MKLYSKSQKELDSLLNKSSSSECDENSDQAESNEQLHLDKSVENSDIPVTNVVHKSLNEPEIPRFRFPRS